MNELDEITTALDGYEPRKSWWERNKVTVSGWIVGMAMASIVVSGLAVFAFAMNAEQLRNQAMRDERCHMRLDAVTTRADSIAVADEHYCWRYFDPS